MHSPHKNSQRRTHSCQKGQGLLEYMILVALMAVATISVIRLLNQATLSRYANIIHSIQGQPKTAPTVQVEERELDKRDLGNFMRGTSSRRGSGGGRGGSSGSSP